MEKRIAVIFRHGDYEKQMANDGPLTENGKKRVREEMRKMTAEVYRVICEVFRYDPFDMNPPLKIAFLVSGSLRGLDTLRVIQEDLRFAGWLKEAGRQGGFCFPREEIRTDFYSSAEDGPIWRSLRQDTAFQKAAAELGWDEALLRLHLPLLKAPVARVLTATREGNEELTIIINQSPHDRLIVEGLTGTRPTDALGLGCYRVVEFA